MNDQGHEPRRTEVDQFATTSPPRPAVYGYQGFSVPGVAALIRHTPVLDADLVVGYLEKMLWVEQSDDFRIRITPLGRKLLRAVEAERPEDLPEPTVADVVLEPTDPLAWVNLTGVVARAGAGLLVDGYFKVESIQWLLSATTMRRVLVSSRHRTAKGDLAAMSIALATIPNANELEIRHTANPEMHDRCVISPDGQVQLLGSSINGVGKHLTTVIAPEEKVMNIYRKRYEQLWGEAELVTPQHPLSED
ncbi:hypothetical protein [Amycolatopsis pithecellobii]|uniref:Uncharacterized protein n=1 Tax=Amycolatopsis pithecellobii TaxID=664692 RepID=A0A6N7YUU6_9PSEU|nr:hypothetical protein [Amycolatopsis pithecellobii]MTD55712.1 hypothetical protein [Amycolatopsis pithecellobii]